MSLLLLLRGAITRIIGGVVAPVRGSSVLTKPAMLFVVTQDESYVACTSELASVVFVPDEQMFVVQVKSVRVGKTG